MAAKKRSTKKQAIAKRPVTDMATVQEQLKNEVANIQQQIGSPDAKSIKTRDKVFTLPDGQIIQDQLKVVIVDFVSQNKLYVGKYDPKNPTPPVCFSIGRVVSAMVPSPNSPDKQADDCASCPMNQFGSDGDGKACKNTRLLAVTLPEVGDGDTLYTLSVSPTAIRGFDAYVASVAKLYEVPPVGVITTVNFHPEKSYASLVFSNPVPNPNVQRDFALRGEAEVLLFAEPEVPEVAPKSKKKTPARRRA